MVGSSDSAWSLASLEDDCDAFPFTVRFFFRNVELPLRLCSKCGVAQSGSRGCLVPPKPHSTLHAAPRGALPPEFKGRSNGIPSKLTTTQTSRVVSSGQGHDEIRRSRSFHSFPGRDSRVLWRLALADFAHSTRTGRPTTFRTETGGHRSVQSQAMTPACFSLRYFPWLS